MKHNRLGKWGENSIAHWGDKEYQEAKDEITRAIKEAKTVKETAGVPQEVLDRLKERKRVRRQSN